MSKIARYAGNLRAFGSNAQGLERTVFGGTNQADDLTSQVTDAYLRGWGIVGPSENPSMEDFNAAMYALSQFIAYQHQMGIPEWDAAQEYYVGSLCLRNGEAYSSLASNNINSVPPSAKWTKLLTVKNALLSLGIGDENGYVGRLLGVQVITSTGTYAPTAGTKKIIVEMVGGGAGGAPAAAPNSTTGTISGGGGAGAYAKFLLDSIPASINITIGSGGTSGNAGGQSVFGSFAVAPGGATGNNSTSNGTTPVTAAGGPGGVRPTVTSPAIAIMTTAGEGGNYAVAARSSNGSGGNGGSTPLSQGGRGNPDGTGFAAGGYGAGGGGCFGSSGSSFTTTMPGGAGGNGVVIVYEYA